MYGYEAAGGLGGVAARAIPNPYMGRTLSIRDPGAMIVGDNPSIGGGIDATTAPGFLLSPSGPGGVVQVSADGGSVEQPAGRQLDSWRQVLDFHNSPAPWILFALLFVYGYVHVSYKRGRAAIGGGFT
jgi:hypothetical protein